MYTSLFLVRLRPMGRCLPQLALFLIALLCSGTPVQAQRFPTPEEVLRELNAVRANPAAYAKVLEAERKHFVGNELRLPGQIALTTQEGAKAWDEAIRFLKKAQPLPPLTLAPGISLAARDHARDIGPKGQLSHTGTDGSNFGQRINRYGKWQGSVAENIQFGLQDARGVVLQLIVDDGVPSRGHRTNIFAPQMKLVGIAVAKHLKYEMLTVMDFAEGFVPK